MTSQQPSERSGAKSSGVIRKIRKPVPSCYSYPSDISEGFFVVQITRRSL